MIFHDLITSPARICRSIVVVMVPAALFVLAGCSAFSSLERATTRINRDMRASDGSLIRKVGLALFENQTFLAEQGIEDRFLSDLVLALEASCSNILLVKPTDPDYPDYFADIPRKESGLPDNFDLARTGRQLGYNAIVSGAIKDISKNKKEHGILWFKGTQSVVQVQVDVEVYDTETGAKLLDEAFTDEIEVEEFGQESDNATYKIDPFVINEAFEHITTDMGEKICEAILAEPWKGYIASITTEKVIISSGKRSGLEPGDEFEVYHNRGVVQGAEEHRFIIPGLKVGEIKITRVSTDTAEAVCILGQDLREGSLIRPKH